jgi:hypothetical protein
MNRMNRIEAAGSREGRSGREHGPGGAPGLLESCKAVHAVILFNPVILSMLLILSNSVV